jgi:DNA-binding response OmpR family regulator
MCACILVIDDERDVLDLVCQILKQAGFETVCVERFEVVHEAIAHQRPDLFLVDLMLPGSDGIQLANTLRERSYRDTPMIAISASEELCQRAAASGHFRETLPKPFGIDDLLRCVGRYLG